LATAAAQAAGATPEQAAAAGQAAAAAAAGHPPEAEAAAAAAAQAAGVPPAAVAAAAGAAGAAAGAGTALAVADTPAVPAAPPPPPDAPAAPTAAPGASGAPGAGAGDTAAASPTSVQRAKLEIEGGSPIDCLFNPAQYSISKVNGYQVQSIPGVSFGVPQFVGGSPREMTLELLFDVTLSKPAKTSVRPITDALFAMMEVPNGGSGAGSAPPTVTFRWGAFESFKAVPVSIDVRYVLFRADGEPVRAWAQMHLLQVAADPRTGGGTPAAQNPTTRSAEAGSTCIVCEGDSLPSLAYDAYGDPTAWRTIARVNNIDDPLSLRPGRRLTIPEVPS
jgi:nucleoid-associated protein YgaU